MTTMKMQVSGRQVWGEGDERWGTLSLSADYANGANAEWAKYTPSAVLTATVKGEILDEFQLGDKVTVSLVTEKPASNKEVQADGGNSAS